MQIPLPITRQPLLSPLRSSLSHQSNIHHRGGGGDDDADEYDTASPSVASAYHMHPLRPHSILPPRHESCTRASPYTNGMLPYCSSSHAATHNQRQTPVEVQWWPTH